MKKYILILLILITGFGGYSQTSNDADAEAFITALNADPSGVKLTTAEMNYITQMVEGMKSIGVWTKMTAIYPFVGSNAFKHKWNLKSPLDTDAAYRLQFFNSPTHSSLGIKFNGTTQYADTYILPSSVLSQNNTHLSFYSNQSVSQGGFDMVVHDNSFFLSLHAYNNNLGMRINDNVSYVNSITNSVGYYIGNRITSTTRNYIKNGQIFNTTVTSNGLPNVSTIYIGAINRTGAGLNAFGNLRFSFASVGSGLTDSEAERLSHLIYYLQGILQRQ